MIDLAHHLRDGDHIVFGQAAGEPLTLVDALIEQAPSIGDLSAFIATSFSGRFDTEATERIALSSMGAIGALRTVASSGALGIVPCHVGQIGDYIRQGLIGCDVAMIQVSPADKSGRHSLGLIGDHVLAAVATARVVIAEVNEAVPHVVGVGIDAARIDVAVPARHPPVELPSARIGETDAAIARHAAAFIADGCVLQVGIGAVPDAILGLLRDRRDLGIHSGMIGDTVVDLIEAGVVTNARKTIDTGVTVTGALIGTRRLYAWADRNPLLRLAEAEDTHGEAALAQIHQLISINSALEVDLTGQVNAEASGASYVGGTGGQVDFVRAGARSPGGRSIVALPSTAKNGTISRIVPTLSGPVTTARSEVDVVVTEYGTAELKGRTLADRARRLIAIAHPDFRDRLDRVAQAISARGY